MAGVNTINSVIFFIISYVLLCSVPCSSPAALAMAAIDNGDGGGDSLSKNPWSREVSQAADGGGDIF